MSLKILIISYFFPPCNKVGGRRWAKFGKYLKHLGYDVFVVCVDVPNKEYCPWEKDIESYRENITRLPYKETRPFYQVNKSPVSFAGKIYYRLSLYKWKLTSIKEVGNRLDISIGYKKTLLKKAEQIIKEHNIKNVIVTGGPFNWCYDAIELKKKYAALNFITDLRDFWSGGVMDENLCDTDKLIESNKEKECITYSDIIFTPAEKIADHLKNKYPNAINKIKVLAHAYDESEMNIDLSDYVEQKDTITFAYGGILYGKMEEAINKLIDVLSNLVKAGYKVKLDVYTFDRSYYELFAHSEIKNSVMYHSSVSPTQLFNILSRKNYILQLRAGQAHEQHFKSTKFYELIALKKPILYFGPEGDVSDFIIENKLGFSGNLPTDTLVRKIIKNKIEKNIPEKFDVSQFSFLNATKKLVEYLK